MRIKKGTKVEVLTLNEGPSNSWRLAEVVSSESRHYTVRYEGCIAAFGEATVERVPWKVIRPCPPPVEVLQDWVPGDVVEVLHKSAWKMATVLKVSGRNHVLVRLFGSGVVVKAIKFDVRARLCWRDGEWIAIGKDSSPCEDLRFRIPSSRTVNNQEWKLITFVNGHRESGNEFGRSTNIALESQGMRSRTVKRKLSYIHSQAESYANPTQKKIRFGNKEGFCNRFNAMQRFQLPEDVEKCIDYSLTSKLNRRSKMIMKREKTNGAVGYSHSVNLVSNDGASVSSSVGSCSVFSKSSDKLLHVFRGVQYEDNDSHSSDAESSCQLRTEERKFILPAEESLINEIHRLELHAYRCTITALYESGPLSWEQELLLTDLRESLHISNDEHLVEVRNLVSSSTCIPTS
ncbi:hypothetical protein vseg_000500 [Gypsophila vaccaria]